MAHRPILNDKQRNTLLSLPTRENELLQYYILSYEHLSHIHTKRKESNRLGFALQLCAFRYPGRRLVFKTLKFDKNIFYSQPEHLQKVHL